eukprot:6122551-Pyramimonas_sp.AAC.1
MAAHVHAQGEWRSSMTIVSLPLRLSAAACSPFFPSFQHLAHLEQNNRQHYQPKPDLSKSKQKADKDAGIKPRLSTSIQP